MSTRIKNIIKVFKIKPDEKQNLTELNIEKAQESSISDKQQKNIPGSTLDFLPENRASKLALDQDPPVKAKLDAWSYLIRLEESCGKESK